MKNLLRLTDLKPGEIYEIFALADELGAGAYRDFLKGKSVVLFFPNTSIRTRVTFEKGIYLLGGQPILFPNETLDKKENLRDVCGYLERCQRLHLLSARLQTSRRQAPLWRLVPLLRGRYKVRRTHSDSGQSDSSCRRFSRTRRLASQRQTAIHH